MGGCVGDIKMLLPPLKHNDLKLQVNLRYLLLQRLVGPNLTISNIRPASINEAKVILGFHNLSKMRVILRSM